MILRDFANERKESAHTIATYIRRHPEIFEGHTGKIGNQLTLDEEAVEILNKVYPLPAPVEVIIDHESRDKLVKLQEYVIELHKEMAEMKDKLSLAETDKLMIEAETQDRIDKAVKIAEEKMKSEFELEYQQQLEKCQQEYMEQIQSLEVDLQKEQNKSWWEKLKESFKKK